MSGIRGMAQCGGCSGAANIAAPAMYDPPRTGPSPLIRREAVGAHPQNTQMAQILRLKAEGRPNPWSLIRLTRDPPAPHTHSAFCSGISCIHPRPPAKSSGQVLRKGPRPNGLAPQKATPAP